MASRPELGQPAASFASRFRRFSQKFIDNWQTLRHAGWVRESACSTALHSRSVAEASLQLPHFLNVR
jgi:hypothetical protein